MRWPAPDPLQHPVFHALASPFSRLADLDPRSTLLVAVGAILQALWQDIFVVFWFIALGTAAWDTMYGRTLHRLLGDYDEVAAQIGLQGKMAGLALSIIVRASEWTVAHRLLPNEEATRFLPFIDSFFAFVVEHGLFSTAMVVGLLAQDCFSIQDKRERFGQPPIPIFSTFMRLAEKMLERVFSIPPKGEDSLKRRSTDDDSGE